MLIFKVAELKKLVEHTEKSTKHRTPSGKMTLKAGLLFVKDSGICLMSNGLGKRVEECYAEGHNPNLGDTREADKQECGEAEVSELLGLTSFKEAIDKNVEKIGIKRSRVSLEIIYL
jgi:hypothetical protein